MFLVINLGLKSIRGIIFDIDGNQIYQKAFPIHTSLSEDKVEQDALEWIRCLGNILDDIRDKTNITSKISHITVTTSSSCILGLNSAHEPVTKVVMVSDKRAQDQVKKIQQLIEKDVSLLNSDLFNAAAALVPKALWFKENEPSKFEEVAYWVGAGAFINYFFTRELVTDPLNASKALHNGSHYAEKILNELGISADSLPEVCEIGTKIQVYPTIIKRYGFMPSCTFIVTTYDAICASIGSTTGEELNACDVSGTVTSVRMLYEYQVKKSEKSLIIQPISFLNKSMIGSSNNLGGGIIEWFKQSFFDPQEANVYIKMETHAFNSTEGSRGVIFLPYLLGERSPFASTNATASFFGINRATDKNDFARAVFESTAYITRDLVELIEQTGISPKSITVSGGLARFDLINQIKADVCNKPVHVVANFESTSIGALILMLLAIKKFEALEEGCKHIVKIRKTIYPSSHNHRIYDPIFKLFKHINQQLMPIYAVHKETININNNGIKKTIKNL